MDAEQSLPRLVLESHPKESGVLVHFDERDGPHPNRLRVSVTGESGSCGGQAGVLFSHEDSQALLEPYREMLSRLGETLIAENRRPPNSVWETLRPGPRG